MQARALAVAFLITASSAVQAEAEGCTAEVWAGWRDMLERYAKQPEWTETRKLYALNVRLCDDVHAGKLSDEKAGEIYNEAREKWLRYMGEMIRARDEATGRAEAS